MSQAVVVKRYRSDKEYQKDASKMMRKKYKVVSVAMQQRRRSFLTILMTGFLVLLFPRKPEFVVTYTL